MKALTLLCVPSLLAASVAGSPIVDQVGPQPHAWFEYVNDDFVTRHCDDKLTAGLKVGANIGTLSVGAQYSMMTWRTNQTRADEISLTAGSKVLDWRGLRLSAGAGFRESGDFGGQKIQNRWHKSSGDPLVYLTYEEKKASPLVIADASYEIENADHLGVSPKVSIGTSFDSFEYEVKLVVYKKTAFYEDDSDYETTSFWMGPSYRGYRGQSLSATAREVHACYDGWFFDIGARLQYMVFNAYMGPHGAYGAVGFDF